MQLLKNKWLAIALFITVIQQLLVAGGTFLLGRIASHYQTDGFRFDEAIFLFICIFLPGTIVHYFLTMSSVKAGKSAQLNYLNRYIDANYNQPTHWRNEKTKQARHDIMCKSGQETIQSAVHFFIDLAATSLNIILNTLAIILITDLVLGGAIILAGLLGLSYIHLQGKKISESSRNEILAENRLNGHLIQSWDNIILGNQIFFERWRKHFETLFLDSKKTAIGLVKRKDLAISVAGMITNGIVLGSAISLAWFYQNTPSYVLGILVMLPRSLQIVMHIQIIQTYVAQWKNLKEKIDVTNESLNILDTFDLNPMIQMNGLSVHKELEKFSSLELDNLINNCTTGRFTIKGPNGIGKSNLLLNLKNKFKLSSIYLPAQHNLMLNETQCNLSTGELAISALNDIKRFNECQIVMLDEWDANLSLENRAKLNELIDQISQERIVIEIRH